MRIVSMLFYSAMSVMIALIVLTFILRLTRNFAPGVSNTISGLTGIAA